MVDTSMDAMKGAFTGFALGGLADTIITSLIYLIWATISGFVISLFYILITYRIRATIFHVTGSGNRDQPFTFFKKGFDFIKLNKDGSWKWLFRRKKEDKFNDEYVYNNKVLVAKVGEKYVPIQIDFTKIGEFTMSPVPYDVRRKAELEMQQVDLDLASQTWWDQGGKQMILALGMVLIVVCFAGFVIWLSFTKTNTVIPHLDNIVNSLNSFGNVAPKP